MQLNRMWISGLIFTLLLLLLLRRIDSAEIPTEEEEDWDEDLVSAEESTGSVAVRDLTVDKARVSLVDLTDQSAHRIITSHQYVFLLGYASWCSRSSELMPEFAAAASAFSGSVLFAKLDAVAHPKAASLYNIKGFPTLLFFTNGSKQQVYIGGDSKDEMINWIRKQTGSPISTVSSKSEAENTIQQHHVFVGGVFDRFEGCEYESFLQSAKLEVGTEFFQTTSLEVAKVFHPNIEKSPTVWVQKTEPERYVNFVGRFTAGEILEFVELNKYPLVVRLTTKNAARFNYSPLKLQVLLFAEEIDNENVLAIYQEAAAKYKGKMLFLVIHNNELDLAMPYLSMYGVQPGKHVVAAFNYENGQKYLLEEDINPQSLIMFCKGLIDGTLPQYYKSEPVPLKKKGYLQIVVGKTFDEIVLDDSKDVFLEVTSPWCAICDAANKTIEKLASALKDIPSIVVAQIDASANEHPKLDQTIAIPAFLFYPAGNKSKSMVISKTTNVKGFIQFLKTNAAIPFDLPSVAVTDAKIEQKTADHKDEL